MLRALLAILLKTPCGCSLHRYPRFKHMVPHKRRQVRYTLWLVQAVFSLLTFSPPHVSNFQRASKELIDSWIKEDRERRMAVEQAGAVIVTYLYHKMQQQDKNGDVSLAA